MAKSIAKTDETIKIPCCPDFEQDVEQDVVNFRRRLVFPTNVRDPRGNVVRVEVIIHSRFTRISGPLAMGDLVYTTTLLPGERVRLASTDRRSRFSFDSESNLSYRSEQISESQYRMSALRAFMADQTSVDSISQNNQSGGSWDFHGDASGSLGFFSASADTNANGSHSAFSTLDYLREHRAHAEFSDHQSVEATRKAHSVSIGEVSSRTHREGESEDHFEAASRVFSNPNKCHAVTFLFYRLNKTETLRFEIVSVVRKVIDPAAPTPIPGKALRVSGQISTIPQEVPATNTSRLEIQQRALQSEVQLKQAQLTSNTGFAAANTGPFLAARVINPNADTAPIEQEVRTAAIKEVDTELAKAGILDRSGNITKEIISELSFERKTSIPTAGIIVRGCLDDCDICETELKEEMKLDLEHKRLQNKLLEKQIELLEKSQEYRCCPCDEDEEEE